jgi:DNA-binding MarR family transcriptional regulator
LFISCYFDFVSTSISHGARLVNLISKRYLFAMDGKVTSTDEIAELIVYLGRAARGGDTGSDLTAAQWTALRFFARANDVSRTPSAFASFHATTRGTASQTIKSLLTKGYLARHGAADDRRSVRFDLTDTGHDVMRDDPLRALSDAIDRLDAGLKSALRQALPALAGELADIRDTVAFGTCGDCRHFSGGGATSYCACVAAELAPADLGRLCINFAVSEDRKFVLPGAEPRKTS